MEIILVRHGRPQKAVNTLLNAAGFANWVKNYNHSLVAEHSLPCHLSQAKYKNYYRVSSDLPRAVHSCLIFSGCQPHYQSKLFREMDIPRYKLPFTIRAWSWVYLNRGLWMLGKKGHFESYLNARRRAWQAASEILSLAQQHDKIIVFSHGYLILHIRKYLRQWGLIQTRKSNNYWGISAFKDE
jgi:broad specificity phosphatase PhoE